MSRKIDYSINEPKTLTSDEILQFLIEEDDNQDPKVSERVDLSEYAIKLANYAYIFAARDCGRLVGFMAVYYNPYPEYSYSTYFGVKSEYQKEEMVGLDLSSLAHSFWQTHKTKGIRYGIRKANKQLVRYHLKTGAIILSEEPFPGTDKIELHMQKDFD